MTRKWIILMAVLGAGCSPVPAARAGTFDVVACDAAPGFVNNSWEPQVTHGGVVAFNACPSGDDAMRGLGARTGYPYPSGWTVPTGAAARWFFYAPPATSVVGVRANAFFSRKNHRWQVGLSNGSQLLAGCWASAVDTGGTCFDGMTADEYLPTPASGAIYTETFCAVGPCPVGGGDWYGWASLTWVVVTLLDQTAPSIANPAGDLWTDQWMSGTRRVTFDAGDNTGIKDVRVLIDGREMARAGRGCDPTVKTCPNWPGAALDVATANGIGDGGHRLAIEATDRGDNRGILGRDVLIDNTPPAAPTALRVDGGDGWKPANRFTLRWANPVQAAAPIAGVDYRLCPLPASANSCLTGRRNGANVTEIKDFTVPRAGEWTLTLWLRDAAGNSRPETSPPPVYLRFDPDPPSLALRPQDPEDPARVRVEASDAISGIARGEIEVRRRGSNAWRTAPAELESGGFSAMLDDEHLRDGVYRLRAHAWDAAGNERSTDRRPSGEPARVVLPLRVKTRMRVGKTHKLHVRRARKGHRVKIVYLRRPVIGHGKRVRIRGRLTAPGGNPLVRVTVDVSARIALPGVDFQPVATLSTSRSGRFAYLVPAGPSRLLRFRYPGAPKIRAQTRDVHVRVRAASSISVDRRHVVNGEGVTFAGTLRGPFLPPAGKLMELQFFDRGKWRTFRTFRAAPSDGSWSYTYRFDGTRGTRTYRFRVRIPKENGYPYSTGRSRRVAVTVRGL